MIAFRLPRDHILFADKKNMERKITQEGLQNRPSWEPLRSGSILRNCGLCISFAERTQQLRPRSPLRSALLRRKNRSVL